MTTIYLSGIDALNVAIAANRMPEIFNTGANLWRPARSYPEARRLLALEPQLVRLSGDARVLLEDLSKQTVQFEDDLLRAAQALAGVTDAVKAAVIDALERLSA